MLVSSVSAMKLAELAERLGCELRGTGDVEIHRIAPIESAAAGDLTFVANPRYARHLATTKASAVILSVDAPEVALPSLRAGEPYVAFSKAIELFYVPLPVVEGIHPTAVVADSASLGVGASVGAFAVIGEHTKVGAGARIGPHVVIYPEVVIGDRFLAPAHVTVRERGRSGHDATL